MFFIANYYNTFIFRFKIWFILSIFKSSAKWSNKIEHAPLKLDRLDSNTGRVTPRLENRYLRPVQPRAGH